MGHSTPSKTAKCLSSAVHTDQICVSAKEAYRLLGIGEKLGRRLVREKVIPSIKLGRRLLIPLDELRRLLAEMVQVDHICRTCARKDKKGKCAAFSTPPKDTKNCPAWTFDQDWNLKVWRDTANYGKKGE